jgi:transcriptional regulator with XRE-family HTH domain
MVRSLRTPGHLALLQVLTESRKIVGLTQQELADKLNRPQSFVAKVETGERRLDVVEYVEWFLALELEPGLGLEPIAQTFSANRSNKQRK